MQPVTIPNEFLRDVTELERDFCRRIRKVDPVEAVGQVATGVDVAWTQVRPYLGQFLRPKVLEVGSGYGFGLCGLLTRGVDAVGVEPGHHPFDGRYDMAVRLLNANALDASRLHQAVAESLPFENESFDVVVSIAVLEHVQDPNKAMAEIHRVLKPGGVALISVPNNDSFYEGHYDVFWLPYLLRSKRLARLYVARVFGRDPSFIDTLNFMRPDWFDAHRAADVDIDIYPCLPVVSRVRHRLDQGLAPPDSVIGRLQRVASARRVVSAAFAAASDVAVALGLASTMNVVYRKQRNGRAHDILA